jgi:hypothetical protein
MFLNLTRCTTYTEYVFVVNYRYSGLAYGRRLPAAPAAVVVVVEPDHALPANRYIWS